jgi:hypothetical protein
MYNYSDKKFEVQKKLLLMFITVLAFLIFAYFAAEISWMTDILLFVELISSVFAVFVGLLALVRFYTQKKKLSFLVLGIGFLFVGVLEAVQLITSVNTFQSLFIYSPDELFPLTMVLSKGFLALIFFLSYLVRKDYENSNSRKEKVVYLVVVSLFVILATIFFFFTDIFNGYQEYLPAVLGGVLSMLMFLFTIIGYWRANTWKYEALEYWQIFSLIFLLLSTIFFLPFLNLEYDLMMKFSVFATFSSYILMLVGFLVSIKEMYEREVEYRESLKSKNEMLLKTKNSVEEAYLLIRKEKWQIAKGKGSEKVEGILRDVIGGNYED